MEDLLEKRWIITGEEKRVERCRIREKCTVSVAEGKC